MGKVKKSFSEYTEETEGLRKKPIKRPSRHNFKTLLVDVIENQDWDELENELQEQGRVCRR